MSARVEKIGFVGLGHMGGDLARCLSRLPAQLTVFDVSAEAMAHFANSARLADDLAGVGRDADVVGLCVQDDKQVLSCVDPLLSTMKPGSVLMVHSTIRPATITEIGKRATERSVELLEAPVSRTVMSGEGPFVVCMTGGDEATAARLRPVIEAYATETLHVGPLGAAMALKICNNLASWCGIMIGLEAVNLAEAAGVPLDKLIAVMKSNGVLTRPAQAFVALRNQGGEERRAFWAVQAGTGEKDLMLAEGLAADAGTDAEIATFVRNIVREKVAALVG